MGRELLRSEEQCTKCGCISRRSDMKSDTVGYICWSCFWVTKGHVQEQKPSILYAVNNNKYGAERGCVICGDIQPKIEMKEVKIVAKSDYTVVINQTAYICNACYWRIRDEEQV